MPQKPQPDIISMLHIIINFHVKNKIFFCARRSPDVAAKGLILKISQ